MLKENHTNRQASSRKIKVIDQFISDYRKAVGLD